MTINLNKPVPGDLIGDSLGYIRGNVLDIVQGNSAGIIGGTWNLATLSGPNAYTGGASFAGAVTMASTLGVTGAATLSSTLYVTGAITSGVGTNLPAIDLQNGGVIRAKNAAGAFENFLWSRFTDNGTYLNYGSGGMFIRNNASAAVLTLGNDQGASFASNVVIGGTLITAGNTTFGTNGGGNTLVMRAGADRNLRILDDATGVRIGSINNALTVTTDLAIQGFPIRFLGSGGSEVGRFDSSGRFTTATTAIIGGQLWLNTAWSGSGETAAGVFIYGAAAQNIAICPDGAAGGAGYKLVLAYFNGSAYKSALEYANTSAAGLANLLLVKGGGTVTIGSSTPGAYPLNVTGTISCGGLTTSDATVSNALTAACVRMTTQASFTNSDGGVDVNDAAVIMSTGATGRNLGFYDDSSIANDGALLIVSKVDTGAGSVTFTDPSAMGFTFNGAASYVIPGGARKTVFVYNRGTMDLLVW